MKALKMCLFLRQSFFTLAMLCVCFVTYASTNVQNKSENKYQIKTLIKVANKIFNDPMYNVIYKYEIQRMKKEILLTPQQINERTVKLLELAKKVELSKDDKNYFVQAIGFLNEREYSEYLGAFHKLIQKYKLTKLLDENGIKAVADILSTKQVEMMKKQKAINFSELLGFSMNPECDKCVWDYHACLTGITYGLSVSYTESTYALRTWVFQGSTLTQQYTETIITVTANDIELYSTHQTTQCYGYLQNCFLGCRN